MKVATFTSLYPSAARPQYALFVEERLRQLLALDGIESAVVAPVPWFPFRHARFGRYASFARTPREEHRAGVTVLHPRYPMIPKIGSALTPVSMAAACAPVLAGLRNGGFAFELIDAHYFYPDGVAAAMLARRFDCPFVVTARGSDLNVHATDPISRRLILWAARQAFAVVTVSQALLKTAVALGIEQHKIVVLRNGVDAQRFRPLDRGAIRARLGLSGMVLVSAANLVPEKGHELVIAALRDIPDATLVIAGEGPQRLVLERLAVRCGVAERVQFLGSIPQSGLIEYYNAADALVLASEREGWPNVLLEAMACGTPVVASNVGGCAEVVSAPEAGMLLPERTPQAVASTIRACVLECRSRAATRGHAERFGWAQTSTGQLELFRAALARQESMPSVRAERPC